MYIKFKLLGLSRGTAKLVCAFLLKYWYRIIGYDVMCYVSEVIVLDRLSQSRMESTGFRGTRTVLARGNGEPNMRRTRTVPAPGSGEPNIQGARTKEFRYLSVR